VAAFTRLYLAIKEKPWNERVQLLPRLGTMFEQMSERQRVDFTTMIEVLPVDHIAAFAYQLGKAEVSKILNAAEADGPVSAAPQAPKTSLNGAEALY
jgi:hypothetical protein